MPHTTIWSKLVKGVFRWRILYFQIFLLSSLLGGSFMVSSTCNYFGVNTTFCTYHIPSFRLRYYQVARTYLPFDSEDEGIRFSKVSHTTYRPPSLVGFGNSGLVWNCSVPVCHVPQGRSELNSVTTFTLSINPKTRTKYP